MLSGNFAEMLTSTPFRDLLHAANLRHGTDGFTSSSEEGVLRILYIYTNTYIFFVVFYFPQSAGLNNHKIICQAEEFAMLSVIKPCELSRYQGRIDSD
jgi:hypothetical protein